MQLTKTNLIKLQGKLKISSKNHILITRLAVKLSNFLNLQHIFTSFLTKNALKKVFHFKYNFDNKHYIYVNKIVHVLNVIEHKFVLNVT